MAQGKIFSLDEAFVMVIDYYIVTSFNLITSFQTLPRSGLTAAGSWKLSFRERIDCDSNTGHPDVPEKHLLEYPFQEAKTLQKMKARGGQGLLDATERVLGRSVRCRQIPEGPCSGSLKNNF